MIDIKKDIYTIDIYQKKIDFIDEDATVADALELFEKEHTDGFVVINRKKEPIGILTRDEINMVILPDQFKENITLPQAMYTKGFFISICHGMQQKKISEIMRKDIVTVDLQTNILSLMSLFTQTGLVFLPVVKNKKIIGTVSKAFIQKAIQQAFQL